ncbi:MAG: DNA primase [Luteibaculaceae bacterium]
MDKKRIIVDYKTLPDHVLEKLAERYPEGEYDNDVIRFTNAKGEIVSAVRVETEDHIYLVKVGVRLREMVEDYESDDDISGGDDDLSIDGTDIEDEEEEEDTYDTPDVDEDEDDDDER